MTTTLMMFATRCRAADLSACSAVPLPPHRLFEVEAKAKAVAVEEMLTSSPSSLRRRHRLWRSSLLKTHLSRRRQV